MENKIIITDLVMQYLPSKRKTTRSGISINCPMCTTMGESRLDTRMRGGVKISSDGSLIYHCFNCGFKTRHEPGERISKNCMKLLLALGVPRQQIPFNLLLPKPGESVSDHKTATSDNEAVIKTFKNIKLPLGAKKLDELAIIDEQNSDFLQVIEYLYNRGPHIFEGCDYYWSSETKLSINKRFIIPFYHKNNIVGWVGRYASNNVPEKLSKYYGDTPKGYMFNMDLLDNDDDTVILVEGVLDAISINGMAVLGNTLSDAQIKILKMSGKNIIIIPDRNKAGEPLVHQAIDNGFQISIPKWNMNLPGSEDTAEAVNKFGILYTLETIYKSATKDKNESLTRFKLVSIT